nr:ATP-binding cassette domain-containing protein [Deinobacterium chartae]
MLALVDGLENDLQVGRALLPFRALSALPSGCEEDADGAEAAPALRRDLRLEAVRFRYPGAERDALNIAALRLEAGQVVALVGPNGAGKSTLTRLLAGLYRPRSGRLEVDGVDLAGVPLEAWRQRVAVVFQDFVRWELSVRENLQLGCPGYALSDAALWELLRAAGAEDSVRALPAGLDTVLSCRFAQGRELSGGQWQRIAIARALAAVRGGARLLILDEPTAALDVRAETEFYARFLELTRGVTTVLVSHRYATVRLADRVLVIGRGRLLEDGPREALLCTGGWFARMARRQAADFDVAP